MMSCASDGAGDLEGSSELTHMPVGTFRNVLCCGFGQSEILISIREIEISVRENYFLGEF